mmetsp:Transcript_8137/g.16719  ORF Transcript_8137/g.16719 Transcript_8137/m.16719 type:complete len:334 (-) Transcript_8137:1402-2403(-)
MMHVGPLRIGITCYPVAVVRHVTLRAPCDRFINLMLWIAQPETAHFPFSLDIYFAAWLDGELRNVLDQLVGGLANVDRHAFGVALHPRGDVHCVANEGVPRHLHANHCGHHRAGGNAQPDLDLGSVRFDELVGDLYHSERELAGGNRTLCAVAMLRNARSAHVRVSDGFHLVNPKELRILQRVVERVQRVQQIHHLKRAQLGRDGGVRDDIREHNGHIREGLHKVLPVHDVRQRPLGQHGLEEPAVAAPVDDDRHHKAGEEGHEEEVRPDGRDGPRHVGLLHGPHVPRRAHRVVTVARLPVHLKHLVRESRRLDDVPGALNAQRARVCPVGVV